jgi:putative oxidoreductase
MSAARGTARIAAGLVFLAFGIGKFTNHGAEVDSFESYGVPSPDAFVYAIGAIEVIGGLLLVLGIGARLAALVLAGNMVGAIIVSGIKEGEPISLTLAPTLLVVMLVILVMGPGPWRLSRRSSPPAMARLSSARSPDRGAVRRERGSRPPRSSPERAWRTGPGRSGPDRSLR